MSQIPSLISDLAVILISAGLVTLLFKWLKQPVVLGYIVAGILAGPSITQIPTVTNIESIRIWADIGVIFLLFALGLDFSFKKLMKVGGTAVIGAITIVIGMMTLGYTTGLSLGWGHMNSLFLGGMLSMSSTTIIFKAFDDMGLRNQRFAGVVFGILVVEDLFAVLLMVLLSTLAVSKHVEGMELLNSVIKLGVFLLFCFVIGIYLIPSFLKKARTFLNDETLLIVSLGLCLGMVIIATKAGFSSALGAFVMGSILAETIDAEHIEHIIKPVKDLFGAIFFVSVGMLIDPALLWEYKIPILILTLVVMTGQILFASFGVLLSGQPVKIAIQSGFSLAQIGEFAFIIASLGLSLGVTDNFLYPIVVAVSVVTTFFTPYMIRMAEPACRVADRIIPKSWMKFLERYSSGSNTIHQKSAWNKGADPHSRHLYSRYPCPDLYLASVHSSFYHERTSGHTGSGYLTRSDPTTNSSHAACDHDEEEPFRRIPTIMAGQQVQPGTIGFIGHFAYYIMYRPSHAARRPFVECHSRYRTGDRSNRHRYCHFIQTAEKTIHPDGTTFFQ